MTEYHGPYSTAPQTPASASAPRPPAPRTWAWSVPPSSTGAYAPHRRQSRSSASKTPTRHATPKSRSTRCSNPALARHQLGRRRRGVGGPHEPYRQSERKTAGI